MSDIVPKKTYAPDFSPREIASLEKYIEDGTPGILDVPSEQLKSALNLYLDGITFDRISFILKMKKRTLMFLAHKYNWYQTKVEKFESIAVSLEERTKISSLSGRDMLVDMMLALQNYYGEIALKYLATRDPKILESADMEQFKIYLKVLEMVDKKGTDPDENHKKASLLGLNLPNGGILTKIDDNTLEVSAGKSQLAETKLGEVLSALAELRRLRDEQNEKQEKKK